jgi:hypothetical protein
VGDEFDEIGSPGGISSAEDEKSWGKGCYVIDESPGFIRIQFKRIALGLGLGAAMSARQPTSPGHLPHDHFRAIAIRDPVHKTKSYSIPS